MRIPLRRIVLLLLLLLPLLVMCKKKCPPCKECEPCPDPDPAAKEIALSAPRNGFTTVKVYMTIAGMSILDTTADNTPLTVLIPQISNHEPFLYSHANYGMTSPIGREVKSETVKGQTYKVIILKDEELLLETVPKEASPPAYTIQGTDCPARPINKRSLRWAPSLTDVLRQPVKFKANPKLHAKMSINAGALYSEPTDFFKWEFRNPPRDRQHVQMVTGVVVHEFTVDLPTGSQVLVIESKDFATGNKVKLAALTAKNKVISFSIGIAPKTERLPGTGQFGNTDDHFKHYYDLLDPTSIKNNAGQQVAAVTTPHRSSDFCFRPTTTLVNCGPTRP